MKKVLIALDYDPSSVKVAEKGYAGNILMGSVTENVLKHSTIPLFIIPTKKEAE